MIFRTIPLVLVLGACTPGQWAAARTIAQDVFDVARVLCIRAHADAAGVSPADVREAVCSTREQLEPWVGPILQAQQVGAATAGVGKR